MIEIKINTFDLHDAEGLIVRQALHWSKGNVQEAAEVCGLSRAGIYRKIKEHGIDLGPLREMREWRLLSVKELVSE